MCGIRIDLEKDRILSIRGDTEDPFSRGHICPKAVALQDIHSDPDRLKHPVRRNSTGWEQISWEQAFEETAGQMKSIQRKHGRNAAAIYLGNPTVHNYGSILFGLPFLRALRTRNRFSATSVDQLPHMIASYLMFGHQLLFPVPDLDRTEFLVIMGGNPVVSNGSMMTAPDVKKRLEAIRRRGGTVVVIDPRRTETAAIADQHHFIRPGSDALLLLSVLHTVFAENLARPARLADFTDGIETIRGLVAEFPPEKAEGPTGIEAEQIRRLARDFAKAGSAVWYGRVGVSTQEFGSLCQWLIYVLNIVTGNLDRPGGAMFTKPAVDLIGTRGMVPKGNYGRWLSRVRKLPEFGGEFPVAVLAEEILTEGPGQIRALITSAGNPVLSTPNGAQLDTALAGLDFMVSIDFYINETTRHARIILPPTGPLEHENYDLIFHLLAIRNTAKFSPDLFAPEKDTRHDWEIFLELQTRLESNGLASRCKSFVKHSAMKRLGAEGLLALLLRAGPYGSRFNIFARGLTLGRLKREVHGVDLGPLEPCLPQRLFTKPQRIQLAPEVLVQDLIRLKQKLIDSNPALSGLSLIGRRQLRSNNSWMHNSERLVKGKNPCVLLMHPSDASSRGITRQNQRVSLDSRAGSIEVEVSLSEEMMPGVVSLPHGWGHDRPGVRLATASARPGVSINDVTDDRETDLLGGGAILNGIPVRVSNIKT
jgi:anaerobic selenocysteine-containing dehydrogenase